MGDEPSHSPGPGGVSAQGHTTDHREATKTASGWELGISATGDGNAGGRIRGDGGLCSKEV